MEGDDDIEVESDEEEKKDATPLWKFVARLGGGKEGRTTKFICLHRTKV